MKKFTKKQILTEASKVKVLVDKLHLEPEIAKRVDDICGPLSIWMINKMIKVFL